MAREGEKGDKKGFCIQKKEEKLKRLQFININDIVDMPTLLGIKYVQEEKKHDGVMTA